MIRCAIRFMAASRDTKARRYGCAETAGLRPNERERASALPASDMESSKVTTEIQDGNQIEFDAGRILVRAPGVESARVTFPEARVIEAAHGKPGLYEAPVAPRTLQRLHHLGVDIPHAIREACDEFVRQMRQIAVLRSRLFKGDLPSLDKYVAEGTTLRRVQHVGALIALSADRTALYMDMGTGKTLTSLVACARRFEAHGLRRVLVVAPATVAGNWKADIERLSMRGRIEFTHASGSQAQRRRQYDRARLVGGGDDYMAIVAVSYGSLANDSQAVIERFDPQAVIIDESHYVKNLTSTRAHACRQVAHHARWVTLLTGTPYSEQPTDIFSQYSILDWRIFGASRDVFIERFCKAARNWAAGEGAPPKVEVDDGKEPLLNRAIYTIGFRARKEDVLDLPAKRPPIHHAVELSPKTKKVIKQLRKDGLAKLDALAASGGVVTAATRMVIGLRVQQAAGGFAKVEQLDEQGQITEETVSIGTEKLDALRELCESLKSERESVVVFARFRAEIAAIEQRLERIYGKGNVSRIDGSVHASKRPAIVNAFQAEEGPPRAIVLQISSGAAGINLTQSRHVIYYSMGYSATDYWQSQDRIHRMGQTRDCFYHLIVATGSDDKVTIDALAHKRSVADAVVESWRSENA